MLSCDHCHVYIHKPDHLFQRLYIKYSNCTCSGSDVCVTQYKEKLPQSQHQVQWSLICSQEKSLTGQHKHKWDIFYMIVRVIKNSWKLSTLYWHETIQICEVFLTSKNCDICYMVFYPQMLFQASCCPLVKSIPWFFSISIFILKRLLPLKNGENKTKSTIQGEDIQLQNH